MLGLHIFSWECYLSLSCTAEQNQKLVERTADQCNYLTVLSRERVGERCYKP